MSGTAIKPWSKVVRVRHEVRSGELSLQEFAADLFDIVNKTGKRPLYEDPAKFFSLTYATPALREIVTEVADRLRGKSAKGIRQLELTYGGGKTHTMAALTHLFSDPDALPAIPTVKQFESAMGGKGPKARVSAVCFDKLDLEKGIPVVAPDGSTRTLRQPWSVIAFQIAGAEGLRVLHGEGKDEERASPPRDVPLEELLSMPTKEGLATLILFDEVLMYASERAKSPTTGALFRTEFENFLQSLTQAVAKVNTAALIVSLLASDPKKDDEFGRQLLADMSNILGRKEDESFLPVGKDDVAEILRRRLLDPETTKDTEAFRPSVVAVVKALIALDPEFAKTNEAKAKKEKLYLDSFPFDPALMDVFYTKWTSGLPLFQRTRGILRTFAVALRDAEGWDQSPLAGASILLSRPDQNKLSSALGDLAGVARVDQTDGAMQNWTAIIEAELKFARAAQDQNPSLTTHREVEQAVVGTFIHSQPPSSSNVAKTTDLLAMIGTAKPDKIQLEKGLLAWAERSWYLDEAHLTSAEKRADGSAGLPKTWRLGNQPNLKQMHDDARTNRVTKPQVDERLLEEIKAAKWIDQGAQGLGAKVHRLALNPSEVPNDGELRYVILGPNGQSESGKPSSLATRFCEEVNGPHNPRSAKNAIVVAAPDRTGISVAVEKIRDHLGWLDVKAQLSSQPLDPVRQGKLETAIDGSKKDIAGAIRQAYCIVVTRGADEQVHAFKVSVDPSKPLFQTIKEDDRSRIKDVTLAPDVLLPGSGSGYDLWRDDEDKIRVKTLVNAFAERPKLPKMLRRKDLYETVANGCEQGLYALSLKRPDGSFRTWWHTKIDEAALNDDDLEAVQSSAATLESIDHALLIPNKLSGLTWDSGLKVSELVSYFDGHTVKIEHEEGWTEEVVIPRCSEAKVLQAVSAAVKAGWVWLTNGPASVWQEDPPAGVVTKAAILRKPPQAVDVSSLTPEALPDAWTDCKTTPMAISQAVAAKSGVASLPWKLIQDAITGAVNSGFLKVTPGAVTWPCQPHEAAALEITLPSAGSGGNGAGAQGVGTTGSSQASGGSGSGVRSAKRAFQEAVLDSSEIAELVEAMEEIVGAAGDLTVRFRVGVEFEDGEKPSDEVANKMTKALKKISGKFA